MKSNISNNKLLESQSIFWTPDYIDASSAWIEHIPFAFWIVEVLKPKILVELGVHTATSYFSFCQAVKGLNIDTACYGVDTWKGDEHAGFYGEDIFEKVTTHNTKEFYRFSTLIRSTFDEAKGHFIDKSIDLLHIDGFHTYEAVKHDFEAWFPKLSNESFVVFHDINVRERDFGVFKLWEELKSTYEHFQFDFGHGLGIISIGKIIPEELKELFKKNNPYSTFLRNIFSEKGNFFKTNFFKDLILEQEKTAIKELTTVNTQLIENISTLQSQNTELIESNKTLELANSQLTESTNTLQSQNAQLIEGNKIMELTNTRLTESHDTLKSQIAQLIESKRALELIDTQFQASHKELIKNYERLKVHNTNLESTNNRLQEEYQKASVDFSEKVEELESLSTKTLEELSTIKKENELLKTYITWYRDTYETRSIFGVLKEKIRLQLKKKNVSATSQEDSSSKTPLDDIPTHVGTVLTIEERASNLDETLLVTEIEEFSGIVNSFPTGLLNIRHQLDTSNLSKVCVFSSFSFSEQVEEYVFYYLNELKNAGFSILFISTSTLSESCVSRLSQYAHLVVERENRCPDFGSWKAGLSLLNWEKLDSVLLTNDSVFGPFFNLDNIISSMKDKYDMWGMTDSYEIDYHLQSYFLYFNKAAVNSDIFRKFWDNVDLFATKNEVIHKYEIGISRLFMDKGFKLGAYANIDVLSRGTDHGHTVINPTLVFWKSLIKAHEFPFLKRELIIKKKISRTYWNVGLYVNVGSWKRTIEQNSSYPVRYILDFINNYYQAIKPTNSNIILRKRKLLFLINNAEIGDEQRIVINFLQWLQKETSFEVEIIISKEGDDDLALEFSRFGLIKDFYSLSESQKINLKERLIDEVALVFSNTLENLEVQKFFSFLDVPQIVYVQSVTPEINDILLIDDNIRWIRENISSFVVSSNFARRNIIDGLGIDDKKVQLVYKFVNHYPVEEFEKQCLKIKSDLGIPSDAFIVGMYGKFHWKDSADLLPVIAATLCQNNDNIHIIWLGADIHSPLYKSVQFDLTKASIDKRVHLVEKQIDTRAFFSIFDVFLMYSREDSFPLVNLESGLAGKPVIYFQNSEDCSEFTNLGIGHPVSYLDITTMAEKVLDYYNNRSRLEIEKESTSKIVKENFTTDIQAPKILQIIDSYYDYEELALAEDPLITFMTHIYYENSWDEIRTKLKNFDNGRNYFLFSISEACLLKEEVIKSIKKSFKNASFLITSNIGKDIGGKLALIDLYLLLEIKSSYVVFLHDKQSHHAIRGEFWKNDLFKILDYDNQDLILELFRDPKIGLVGSKEHIVNEYDKSKGTFRNNNQLSKNLLMQFGISIDNYDFLGGSIYWLRSSIIENFFTRNHPIQMRENLEAGNVLDLHGERLAHTWERMFSWIAANDGYTIKGI